MIEDFLLRWTPVLVFVAVLVYLLDHTVGRVLDKMTRKNEAIRSEAEKHMDKILNGEL